jgi:hypothetical protein
MPTTNEALELSIEVAPKDLANRTNIPLKVHFKNGGKSNLRLLDLFSPEEAPLHFRVHLTRPDGKHVTQHHGGGKIDPHESAIKYIELAPGQTYDVTLNLAEIIPNLGELPAGPYHLAVSYHNQHGENCFIGKVHSPKIDITLPGPAK